MDDDTFDTANSTGPSMTQRVVASLTRKFQQALDRTTIYPVSRWLGSALLLALFAARTISLRGWFIVAYGLGIYLLNLLIGFLSPKFDPELEGPVLPTNDSAEFRPFVRRLPEFRFWYAATRGVIIATAMTFFDAFNVPVYWPVLVVYFASLFFLTMRRQVQHMIKYRYLPFTMGKKQYASKEAVDHPAHGARPRGDRGAGKGKAN